MRRTLPLLSLLAALSLLVPQITTAQNEAEEPAKLSGYRLPVHFGKLGIDDAQRQRLHAIAVDYESRIVELEKQIAALEGERDEQMETLLTPGQRLRLNELREASARRSAEQAAGEPDQEQAAATPAAAP
jgi:hypothetical protein